MSRSHHRPRHRFLAVILTAVFAATGISALSAMPAAAATLDGRSAATAAASCWEIKQRFPASQNGAYWLVTPALRRADQFFCDMATEGGGWVLVGRGREGWTYGRNGLSSTAQVRSVVSGPGAFVPRQLDGGTIDGLLNGTRVDALVEGVRIRRAAATEGNRFQEVRVDYANMAQWTWPFGATFPLARHSVTLPWVAGSARNATGGTIDSFQPAASAGSGWQTHTAQRAETGFRAGWAYGSTMKGSPDSSSLVWTPGSGGYAVPFAQVWIRPRLLSTNLYIHPAGPAKVSVSSVVSRQVLQRDGSKTADIPVAGRYSGPATRIEARWAGGPWTVVDSRPRGGFFAGVLSDRAAGQGVLEVRMIGSGVSASASVPLVGVGDIFAVAGQSNAVGYAWNAKPYSHPLLTASNFSQTDSWKDLADPVSSGVGQIDRVSMGRSGASPWPLLASMIMAKTNAPVAFVPAAKGGSSITLWETDGPLYASLQRRIDAVGGQVKGVLWHQGESDAGTGMSRADYERRLTVLVRAIARDTGNTPTLVANIGQHPLSTATVDQIRLAQKSVIDREPSALDGPVTYDIDLTDDSDVTHAADGIHFASDADRELLVERWWAAIDAAFYGGPSGTGPVLDAASSRYDDDRGVVELVFGGASLDAGLSTAAPATFTLSSGGVVVPISRVEVVAGGHVLLTVDRARIGTGQVTLSYASTRNGVDHALYDVAGLPAFVAVDVPIGR